MSVHCGLPQPQPCDLTSCGACQSDPTPAPSSTTPAAQREAEATTHLLSGVLEVHRGTTFFELPDDFDTNTDRYPEGGCTGCSQVFVTEEEFFAHVAVEQAGALARALVSEPDGLAERLRERLERAAQNVLGGNSAATSQQQARAGGLRYAAQIVAALLGAPDDAEVGR